MERKAIVVSAGLVLVLFAWTSPSFADEMLGGEPKDFRLAILSEDDVSFVLPSVVIVDEKARQRPLELIVTNHTKKEHGFAIDRLKVKELLKPGETKTVKVSVSDLDSLGGSEQKTYRIYDPLHAKDVGSVIYVIR
jgi:hypothetical protein